MHVREHMLRKNRGSCNFLNITIVTFKGAEKMSHVEFEYILRGLKGNLLTLDVLKI